MLIRYTCHSRLLRWLPRIDPLDQSSKLSYISPIFHLCQFVSIFVVFFSTLFSTFLVVFFFNNAHSFFISKSSFFFYDCLFHGLLFLFYECNLSFHSSENIPSCQLMSLILFSQSPHLWLCVLFLSASLGTFLKYLSIFGTHKHIRTSV